MKTKTKVVWIVSLVAMFFVSPAISQSVPQEETFQAAGLTEPVLPEPGKPAVKVTFPHADYYMLFDPPQVAGYFTPEGIGFSNEWAETRSAEHDGDDYGEVGFDRNAVMWIEKQNPARKVVRFRGALVNSEGEVQHAYIESGSPYGEGDWSDEWFYIYPDGVSVRVVKIYTGKTGDAVAFWGKPGYAAFWGVRGTIFETQETFIHGVDGLQPSDIIETEALTLITMDGRYKRISYFPYPPDKSLFDPANIQMVNLKSKYHPFTIVTENDVEIKPYYMPMEDHEHIDSTMFITWPRRGHFEDGKYTSALSHVIKWDWHERTENTIVQVYLLGMTGESTEQQRVDKLVRLAGSWQNAPELIIRGDGYRYDGYEIKEKAYLLTRSAKNEDMHLSIMANPERPLVNPVLVIRGFDRKSQFRIMINNTNFIKHRAGYEDDSLVIWIPFTSMEETSIKLLF
jgi:hypothetical protein